MSDRTRLTTVETVTDRGSWLCTVRDPHGVEEEVILVPCPDEADPGTGVEAWMNRCTHEAQRLDRGFGAALRDGEIVCPKHGSMFDTCSGYCGNGDAADTTLPSVDIEVDDGQVYLTDGDVRFLYEGTKNDEDDGPSSTSHLQF